MYITSNTSGNKKQVAHPSVTNRVVQLNTRALVFSTHFRVAAYSIVHDTGCEWSRVSCESCGPQLTHVSTTHMHIAYCMSERGANVRPMYLTSANTNQCIDKQYTNNMEREIIIAPRRAKAIFVVRPYYYLSAWMGWDQKLSQASGEWAYMHPCYAEPNNVVRKEKCVWAVRLRFARAALWLGCVCY